MQTEKKKTMLFGDYVGNNAISLCVLRISERVTLLVWPSQQLSFSMISLMQQKAVATTDVEQCKASVKKHVTASSKS